MNWWLVASRLKHGMMTVCPAGRFGPMKEHVSGLGATTTAVLETTTDIFGEAGPSNDEEAALELSEKVAESSTQNELSDFSDLCIHLVGKRDGSTRCGPKPLNSSIAAIVFAMQAT
jgi:hypothetical protein